MWDKDSTQTVKYGKRLRFVQGHPSSQSINEAESSVPVQASVLVPATSAPVSVPLTISVPAPVSMPVPAPGRVDNMEVADEDQARPKNHAPEQWNVIRNLSDNFNSSSDENAEDQPNNFDVSGWKIDYTPQMMKEVTNVYQTNVKRIAVQ